MNNPNDLISRDAAIAAFDDERVDRNYGDVSPESVIRVIESILPIDAVPVVHGRWVYEHDDPVLMPCSVCGYQVYRYNNTNYCPNCGAKMDYQRKNN